MKLFTERIWDLVKWICWIIAIILSIYYFKFNSFFGTGFSQSIDDWQKSAAIIFTPIAFLCTFITTILAWKIYQNFDVKKSFINAQLKVVCELSNDLSSFGMNCFYISAGDARNYPRFFDFFSEDMTNETRYRGIYFSSMRPIEVLPFIKYRHNILLPNKIAKAIEQFDVQIFKPTLKKDLPDSYTLILSEDSEDNKNQLLYYFMEYKKFHELTKSLVDKIETWLKDYGAKDINIPAQMIKK